MPKKQRKPRSIDAGLEKIDVLSGCGHLTYKVTTGERVLLGFITKAPTTATETHPWRAFRPRFVPGSIPQFGDMIDAAYGPDAQRGAVRSLLAAEHGDSAKLGYVFGSNRP